MKVIVTADIHISIKKDITEDWQITRYRALFKTLIDACVAEEASLIITGDLFDKSHPTLQELQLVCEFFAGLHKKNISTTVIGGNHETISEGKDTYSYLKHMVPSSIELLKQGCTKHKQCNTMFHFMSHCCLPKDVASYADGMEEFIDDCGIDRHILFTHFRCTVGEYVKEEIDVVKLCSPFCLVVAGDIHSELATGNLVYTNQPVNSSFASMVNTSYLIIEISSSGDISWKRVATKLPSLLQWNIVAADIEAFKLEVQEHFDQNEVDMPGLTDFIKVNITGTLKELRTLTSDSVNVKFNKILLVDDVIISEVGYQKAVENMSMDMQLIEYLKSVPYAEDNINALLEIWKEVV